MPQDLTLPIIITAALLDSINPCVIGVLVFLLVLMSRSYGKHSYKILFMSSIYVVTVYVSYLLLGIGIIKAVLSLDVTLFFYVLVAIIAAIAGLLEIKDFFRYGWGINLAIFPSEAKRLKYFSEKLFNTVDRPMWQNVVFMILLGFFVVLIELPCTGAPYLAILGLISQGDYWNAMPLLLLYNLIFVLPLIIIIALGFFGMKLKSIERWKQKYKKWMRLAVGLFLLAMSWYMIYSVWPLLKASF